MIYFWCKPKSAIEAQSIIVSIMSAEEVDYEEDTKVDTKSGIKRKGRGHGYKGDSNDDDNRGGVFERIEQEKNFGPMQCNHFIFTMFFITNPNHP